MKRIILGIILFIATAALYFAVFYIVGRELRIFDIIIILALAIDVASFVCFPYTGNTMPASISILAFIILMLVLFYKDLIECSQKIVETIISYLR